MAGSANGTLLLAGIGPGLGISLARTFAGAGYDVIGVARSTVVEQAAQTVVAGAGRDYRHIQCDLTDPDQVADRLTPHIGEVEILIHNAHHLMIEPFATTTPTAFERVWRVACLSAMTVAQVALPPMLARGRGTILLTGATAALRGAARFSAFASAKFALRGLSQSLAREYAGTGIHVAHIVLDGLIDEPQSDNRFGPADAGDRMDPEAIADTYLALASQPATAWTQEIDLRPAAERF